MAKKKAARKKSSGRKWSAKVAENSDALDLKSRIFTKDDPDEIAKSLKRSAQRSHRKKGTPYQSAMSMLSFYINRAGEHLSKEQKDILERSKDSLRKLFHRE